MATIDELRKIRIEKLKLILLKSVAVKFKNWDELEKSSRIKAILYMQNLKK